MCKWDETKQQIAEYTELLADDQQGIRDVYDHVLAEETNARTLPPENALALLRLLDEQRDAAAYDAVVAEYTGARAAAYEILGEAERIAWGRRSHELSRTALAIKARVDMDRERLQTEVAKHPTGAAAEAFMREHAAFKDLLAEEQSAQEELREARKREYIEVVAGIDSETGRILREVADREAAALAAKSGVAHKIGLWYLKNHPTTETLTVPPPATALSNHRTE